MIADAISQLTDSHTSLTVQFIFREIVSEFRHLVREPAEEMADAALVIRDTAIPNDDWTEFLAAAQPAMNRFVDAAGAALRYTDTGNDDDFDAVVVSLSEAVELFEVLRETVPRRAGGPLIR